MRRLLTGLAAALLIGLVGTGAVLAIGDNEVWDHLTVGVTMVKVSRGLRMVYTWDQAGGVQAFDLDAPGVTIVYTLADNTFAGFQQFVADQ